MALLRASRTVISFGCEESELASRDEEGRERRPEDDLTEGGERIFEAIPRWAGAMLDRRELEATRSEAVDDRKSDDMVDRMW
jgi:hypothetical protein